jgi:hypothetical protein
VLQGLARRGDNTAIVDAGTGRSISGSHMIGWITHETRRLQRAGMEPGDTIGLVGQAGTAWLATAYGAIGAGLTVVPLNPMVPPALATGQLTAADAATVVTDDASAEWATLAAGDERTIMSMADVAAPPTDGSNGDGSSIDLDADAFLLSSSGTTGMPKLVSRRQLRHRRRYGIEVSVHTASRLTELPDTHAAGPLRVGARGGVEPLHLTGHRPPIIVRRRRSTLEPDLNDDIVGEAAPVVAADRCGNSEPASVKVIEQLELPHKRGRRASAPPHRHFSAAEPAPPDLVPVAPLHGFEQLQSRPRRHIDHP